MLHSICQQIWKTQQWPQDWKRLVFIPTPNKGNTKEYSNCCTTILISHASKVMLKILQARLQQYVNQELPDVHAGFRKGRGTRDQIISICGIVEKAREFQKIHLLHWLYQSLWLCGSQQTVGNSSRNGNTRHLTCLLRNLFAGQEVTVRTRHGTMIWFKFGKGVHQACIYCHPAYLTYMQSTSWETLGWKKHKLESRLLGEISITSDMQMTPPLRQRVKMN